MERRTGMMKVLCPVEGKNGKTFWMRCGTGFPNKDGSTNIYLDAYPANGKLQLRSMDEDRPRPNMAAPAPESDSLPF